MSKSYILLEMIRRKINFDIYLIRWNSAFNGTTSNKMKRLTAG